MTGEDGLRREVFALAYYLKWSVAEILALPAVERRAYLELLAEQLDRERDAAREVAGA
jgi:hypothetical protein